MLNWGRLKFPESTTKDGSKKICIFLNGCSEAIWGAIQRGDFARISIFRLTKNFELLPCGSMTVVPLWVTTLIFSKKLLPGREKCVPDTHFETSPGTKKWLPRRHFFVPKNTKNLSRTGCDCAHTKKCQISAFF